MIWYQPNDTCLFSDNYIDVIMTTMTSQITSLTVVYSTVYSDADQRKYQSSASLAFVWGIHGDRWIPRTKGQLRGKCSHLMTSSCECAACHIASPIYQAYRSAWNMKPGHWNINFAYTSTNFTIQIKTEFKEKTTMLSIEIWHPS